MNKKITIFIIITIALIAIISDVYLYSRLKLLRQNIKNTQISTQGEESLLMKVSQLMLLPENEEPTIATVSDPSALKDQKFFVDTKKGDKVLLYIKSGKAVLYRPDLNKIIDVSPISNNYKLNDSQ